MSDPKWVPVRQVMRTDVTLVNGRIDILGAMRIMKKVQATCLIVEKRHENDEYGMLLFSDVAQQVIAKDRAPERVNVYEIYDSGGVTTSTVTVPLVTALGLGLAETVPGRSPLLDGFGLVAFACLFPIISVLAYAQLGAITERFRAAGRQAAQSQADLTSLEES